LFTPVRRCGLLCARGLVRLGCLVWLVCAALALPAASAFADAAADADELALRDVAAAPAPRPEAPPRSAVLPIEGGALRSEVSFAFGYIGVANEHTGEEPSLALVLGARTTLWQWIEVGLELPFLASRSLPQIGGGKRHDVGLGNLGLRVKLSLLPGPARELHLAAYFAANLPTFVHYTDQGQPGDLGNRSLLRPGLALGWRRGRVSLQIDASALFSIDDPSAYRSPGFLPGPPPSSDGGPTLGLSLMLGSNLAVRATSWLSVFGGLQFRGLVYDSLEHGASPHARGHFALHLGLRTRLGRYAFFEGAARWTPWGPSGFDEGARSLVGLHFALGARFGRGLL
jgi:hypothetical protein